MQQCGLSLVSTACRSTVQPTKQRSRSWPAAAANSSPCAPDCHPTARGIPQEKQQQQTVWCTLAGCVLHARSLSCALRAAVQILWKFSIYLESIAILPQLILLTRTQNTDNLTGNYIFLLGWVMPQAQRSSARTAATAAAVGQPGGDGSTVAKQT